MRWWWLFPIDTRVHRYLFSCQGTIISMHENPFSVGQAGSDSNEEHNNHAALVLGRQSLLNSFRQLSKSNEQRKFTNPFMTLGIRSGPQATDGSLSDAPGLLFYYLFDDWYSTYSLVIRDKNQYTAKLEKLVSSNQAQLTFTCLWPCSEIKWCNGPMLNLSGNCTASDVNWRYWSACITAIT